MKLEMQREAQAVESPLLACPLALHIHELVQDGSGGCRGLDQPPVQEPTGGTQEDVGQARWWTPLQPAAQLLLVSCSPCLLQPA